eukprot:scaffold26545_cov25-Cyclotella_meneghiniana.AAC.2
MRSPGVCESKKLDTVFVLALGSRLGLGAVDRRAGASFLACDCSRRQAGATLSKLGGSRRQA